MDTSAYYRKFEPISEEQKSDLLETYDNVYVFKPKKSVYSSNKYLNQYLKFKELKERIQFLNEKERFNAAVFPTDFSYEMRVLSKIAPKIEIFILQVSFKRRWLPKEYGFIHKVKAYFYNDILEVPLFRKKYQTGDQNPKAWYLFWTEKWAERLVNPKGTKVAFSNAVLEQVTEKPRIPLKAELTSRIAKRPLVCIFLNKRLSIGERAFEEYAEFYMNLVENLPQLYFIIKVHPAEDSNYCQQLYAGLKRANSEIVFSEFSPETLLSNCDLFITQWSTAILQSLMYKVRTLLVNPNNRHDMDYWGVGDFPLIATSKQELVEMTVSVVFESELYWNQVYPFILNSFGQSFEDGPKKMVSIIENVLQGKQLPQRF